ncbi:hypothetical protein BT96DRAFT_947891 [Gymnopus androsaceus JB14]|nr:hypothetical protein BT96DRAFT_947891 [Gymnopus androsaceus JB14]
MERTRIVDPQFNTPSYTNHPRNAPINYFSPWYHNNVLTLCECAMYMNNGVTLPLPQHCQSADDIRRWRKLNTKKFMEEYENDVLALYDIPMEEELECLDRNEDEDDEDNEEDITGDSDEDGK